MYGYLMKVENPNNMNKVAEILSSLNDTDILTEETIKRHLRQVEKLKEIGEKALYNQILNEYKQDPSYSKYMN